MRGKWPFWRCRNLIIEAAVEVLVVAGDFGRAEAAVEVLVVGR
jgi:hypothetical protein